MWPWLWQGTVIRVHALPSASKLFTFRRGLQPATIYSLSFSPPGIQPPLLCACSSHGSVHAFQLSPPPRGRSAAAAASAAATGLLSAVTKWPVADVVESPRYLINIKLPTAGVPCTSAIYSPEAMMSSGAHASGGSGAEAAGLSCLGDGSRGGGGGRDSSGDGGGTGARAAGAEPTQNLRLAVATLDGFLYE